MTAQQQPSLAERIGRIVEAARQSIPDAQLSVSISITIKDETNTTSYHLPPAPAAAPDAAAAAAVREHGAAPTGPHAQTSPTVEAERSTPGNPKPATPQQLKAIRETGMRVYGVTAEELAQKIRETYGCDPEQLTAQQASELFTNLTETARKAPAKR